MSRNIRNGIYRVYGVPPKMYQVSNIAISAMGNMMINPSDLGVAQFLERSPS
jgi:uncharacterized membrane protein